MIGISTLALLALSALAFGLLTAARQVRQAWALIARFRPLRRRGGALLGA